MGQYYKAVFLNEDEKIIVWVDSMCFGDGMKLMDHVHIDSNFVAAVEYLLAFKDEIYSAGLVWSGDYADLEKNSTLNLYSLATDKLMLNPNVIRCADMSEYKYIVNHTKKEYVDKTGKVFHPLPLLTAEGNGRGGGDYQQDNEYVGYWARDNISVEKEVPDEYKELITDFDYII